MLRHFALFLLSISFFACPKDDDIIVSAACGAPFVIVTNEDTPSSTFFNIAGIEADGRCLNITISASGCGPDAWTAALYTDGAVAESLPPQGQVSVQFSNNNELCQAVFTKTFTFDLQPFIMDQLPFDLTVNVPFGEPFRIRVM